eukprot:6137540-Prymnesium_polylepis.1
MSGHARSARTTASSPGVKPRPAPRRPPPISPLRITARAVAARPLPPTELAGSRAARSSSTASRRSRIAAASVSGRHTHWRSARRPKG